VALAMQIDNASYVHLAGFGDPLTADAVRINYVDHSTFLIETAAGATIATDFTGFLGPYRVLPDVVTMNHAHDSHFTSFPNPAIPHVLRGWGTQGQPADHYLEVDDVLIRNVTTNIRSRLGTGTEVDGNSIFILEVAGLCIGHLGHLHHEPTPEQYARIGRLDVVMAAVDGGRTLDLPTITRVLNRLRSSIVIPMHWFSDYTLDQFVRGMRDEFDITFARDNMVEVSLSTLPKRPTVVVIAPAAFSQPDFDN
jgi:L-ascorbate metabolism protein UlaG (beta-lactamase superfamily)